MHLCRISYLIATLQSLLLAGTGNCPDGSAGTTVVFVNGIDTTEPDAQIESGVLAAKLTQLLTPLQQQCTQVTYKWNSHGSLGPISFLGDLYESARQLFGDNTSLFFSWLSNLDDAPTAFKVLFEAAATHVDETEYVNITDLAEHVRYYQDQINNHLNIVIVVPHSQGNWFANESYRSLQDNGMTLPDSSKFNIVAVASPASAVEGYPAGRGEYTTLCEDFIWKLPTALTYNLVNNAVLCTASKLTPLLDPLGIWKHSFTSSYLGEGTNSEPVILGEIVDFIPRRRPPTVSVTPNTYDFGSVVLGSSAQKDFTIQNTGNTILSISNMTSSPGFSLLVAPFPISINPGATASFAAFFFPGSIGLQQGTINIYSNASGSPTQVSVSGTGINTPPPPPPTCTLTANPTTINRSQSSMLTWTTANSPATASIDNGIGSVNTAGGNTSVSPTATTTYTLTVMNTGGTNTCSANVTVSSAGVITFVKTVGSSGDDYASSVQQTLDGGFILAGNTTGLGAGGSDVLLAKVDQLGAIQWAKTSGSSGNDSAFFVRQTSDGGYIVTGQSDAFAGFPQSLVEKFDNAGGFQWASSLGAVGQGGSGQSVQQTTDGGYIVTGYPEGAIGGLGLFKYDSAGQLQWLRRAAGVNHYGNSVQQTSDGGYVVAGAQQFGAYGVYDVSLLKFDGSGNLQWAQLAVGNDFDAASAVQQTFDGGYVVAGVTASAGAGGQDVLLLKYDALGTLQWARTAGGSGDDAADSVQQTTDAGYIVSGHTSSFGAGRSVHFLIKFDSAGSLQWAKAGVGSAGVTSVQQISDGGYVMAGSTADFGAGGSDVLLIRTDQSGNIAGCATWLSVSPSIGTIFQSTSASPSIESPTIDMSAGALNVNIGPLTLNTQCTSSATNQGNPPNFLTAQDVMFANSGIWARLGLERVTWTRDVSGEQHTCMSLAP